MIGSNQLNLNPATLTQALQERIDKRMGEHAPRVTSICTTKNGYTETYCVGVESSPPGKTEGTK